MSIYGFDLPLCLNPGHCSVLRVTASAKNLGRWPDHLGKNVDLTWGFKVVFVHRDRVMDIRSTEIPFLPGKDALSMMLGESLWVLDYFVV